MVTKNKKSKTIFICSNCGHESPKWLGKCPGCYKWNTFVEQIDDRDKPISAKATGQLTGFSSGTFALNDVTVKSFQRIKTGISEF
ncbi:MAG: DNA repair protein RadA, partial [Elusimicrobia bacterium]|nr:DNA repair protein RadA [Elusimicrobiota bacterium]